MVRDIFPYGGRLIKNKFCMMYGAGNDLVGITTQEAAGCTMTIFTTGRRTLPCYCTPLLRVSSNKDITIQKPNWIDIDASLLMTRKPIDEAGTELLDIILMIASGRLKPCAEKMAIARWVFFGIA